MMNQQGEQELSIEKLGKVKSIHAWNGECKQASYSDMFRQAEFNC